MVKKYCRLILFIAIVAVAVIYFRDALKIAGYIIMALKPVLIALFLALVFNIPVKFLNKKILVFIKNERYRNFAAVGIAYITVFGLLFLGLYFLVPSVIESAKGFAEKLPEYGEELRERMISIFSKVGVTAAKIDEILAAVKDRILSKNAGINGTIDKINSTIKGGFTWFFATIISIYMLLDKNRLLRQFRTFIKAITTDKVSKMLNNTSKISSVVFSQFLGGQFVEALLLGVVTMVGMYVLKLPYAPIVSTVVFVANLIPLIGAYVGGAVGFVLISFVSVRQGVIFIIFSVILQQIENNIFYPKVVGKSLGLSGFWIMSAVLVGGALFGFWGIMLGVPAVAVIYKSLGHRLGGVEEGGELLPEILKKPDKPGGGNSAE